MKYIVDKGEGWDHRPYWLYIDSVRHFMPQHLYECAANEDNHNLESPNSLHDSWLMSWNVSEIPATIDAEERVVLINCALLGSRQDRIIHLRYKSVLSHEIRKRERADSLERWGHSDLLVHEIQMIDDGVFSHELVFATGYNYIVIFRELKHWVEIIENVVAGVGRT
jgi:hypothetical protein